MKLKVLIAAIHYPVCSARYYADAFRRIGCDVKTVGSSTGNRIPWPRGNEDGTWGDWTELDPKYTWNSDGDLTTVFTDWYPDLVIVAESAWAYHHPVYQDAIHIVAGVDNHVRSYRQAGIARYFLAHKNISMMEWQDDMEWLPCGYDGGIFTPSPLAYEDRHYDIAMIGVLYPQRVALLNALADAGLKVLAGTGWVYDQYAAAYHNARISLCMSANGDLAQRVFETAALGCAILTDRVADLMDAETNKALGLQGFVTYDGVEECVAQARHLLETEPLEQVPIVDGDEIVMQLAGGAGMGAFAARQMCESVTGVHTWDRRAERIVEWYNETYRQPHEEDLRHVKATGGVSDGVEVTEDVDGGTSADVSSRIEPVPTGQPARAERTEEQDGDFGDEVAAQASEEEAPPEKPKRKKRGH